MENQNDGQIQPSNITEEVSRRITSLRFILIVFIVCVHANLRPYNAINYYHYDFIQPKWIEIFKDFICVTLGEAAVSLFFLFSSYLQFSKNDSYGTLLKKRTRSLLLPYVLWTIITIILYFIAQSIPQTTVYFRNPISIVRNWKALDWIKVFTYHDFNNILKIPLVGQFWFLRELMIFILLSPIFKFMCEKVPGCVIVLISIFAFRNIPLFFTVSTSALFFYILGYFFAAYKISFFAIADKIELYVYIFILFLSIYFDQYFESHHSFIFLNNIISCLFLLRLSAYLINNQKTYKVLEYLAGYAFFLFAVHMPFLNQTINKLTQKGIPLHGVWCLVQFLLAAFLTLIIGTGTGILLNKICPPLFNVLNGRRKK